MIPLSRLVLGTVAVLGAGFAPARAQDSDVSGLTLRLSSIAAVTGYEQRMVDTIQRLLPRSQADRAGNAVLLLGGGSGRRLLVCPDVPVGWPLRYSHSPAETMDLRDLVSLARMVQAVAEGW
jgi:putative aminopeptidase FrvX